VGCNLTNSTLRPPISTFIQLGSKSLLCYMLLSTKHYRAFKLPLLEFFRTGLLASLAMGLDASDSLAVTAIAFAVVALCGTIGQILQQYLGTSEGYRRCQSSVMGLWAQATRRIFNWGDMRFEVIFQTPVIYLSRPFNDRWPLINRPIHYVDGSGGSYKDTGVEEPLVRQQKLMDRWGHNMVASGTDGEETSWVTLLGVLQDAKAKSREWDHKRLATPRSIKYAYLLLENILCTFIPGPALCILYNDQIVSKD
jgi:hypothetical protein